MIEMAGKEWPPKFFLVLDERKHFEGARSENFGESMHLKIGAAAKTYKYK
jgi:hypothetical protein